MIRYLATLALCALLALGTAAYGAATGSSFFGPTGLIEMPTADNLGAAEFRVFGSYLTNDDNDSFFYGANVGLGAGVEVGVSQVHHSGDLSGTSDAIVNAKWTAYKGGPVMPAIAVGALSICSTEHFADSFDEANPFIVASKSLPVPGLTSLSVHAGYIAGGLDRAIFGAQLGISSNAELIAEYFEASHDITFGARYNMPSGLSFQVGSIHDTFTVGMFYNRGLGK